jgi:hypothetical protein
MPEGKAYKIKKKKPMKKDGRKSLKLTSKKKY